MSNPNGMASASAAGLHQVYGCKIAGLLETRGPKTRYIPYQKLKIGDTEKPRHARPLQIQRFRIVHGDMAQPAARKKNTIRGHSRWHGATTCYDSTPVLKESLDHRFQLSLGEGGDRRPETKTVWTVRCEDRDWPCGVGGEAW